MIRIFCEIGSAWMPAAVASLEAKSYLVDVVYGDPIADKIAWQEAYEVFASSNMATVWNMSRLAPSVAGLIGIAADGSVLEAEFQSILNQVLDLIQAGAS